MLALGASLCSNFAVSVAIIQWFERHRARALSAVQFGSAVGGLFVVAVAWSIQTYGWRVTAFGSGVFAILVGWPLARVVRSRPEAHGETIDGVPPAPVEVGQPAEPASPGFTARQALRTSAFWLISLGHGFALFVVSAFNVHAITHIRQSLGWSIAQASVIITLVTAGQFLGVIMGWGIGEIGRAHV